MAFSYFYNLRAASCLCNLAPASNTRKFKKYIKSSWSPSSSKKYRTRGIIVFINFRIYWKRTWSRVRDIISDRKPKIKETLRE